MILTLSRINREDLNGKAFIKPNLVKSLLAGLFTIGIIMISVFLFNTHVYYYFYSVEILCFWLISKMICFLLIYDKLNSKKWLRNILRFPDLHFHGIIWQKEEENLKNRLQNQINNIQIECNSDDQEFNQFINRKKIELVQIFQTKLS